MLPCVSQGAAPLGREMTITAAEGNVIHELAGRPALETSKQIISELSPRERALIAGGLLIGIVIDGGKPEYEQGDFLVRGRARRRPDPGAIAVGAPSQRGPGDPAARARRALGRRGPASRAALRVAATGERAAGRRAGVLLQRPRQRDVRRRRPRRA